MSKHASKAEFAKADALIGYLVKREEAEAAAIALLLTDVEKLTAQVKALEEEAATNKGRDEYARKVTAGLGKRVTATEKRVERVENPVRMVTHRWDVDPAPRWANALRDIAPTSRDGGLFQTITTTGFDLGLNAANWYGVLTNLQERPERTVGEVLREVSLTLDYMDAPCGPHQRQAWGMAGDALNAVRCGDNVFDSLAARSEGPSRPTGLQGRSLTPAQRDAVDKAIRLLALVRKIAPPHSPESSAYTAACVALGQTKHIDRPSFSSTADWLHLAAAQLGRHGWTPSHLTELVAA